MRYQGGERFGVNEVDGPSVSKGPEKSPRAPSLEDREGVGVLRPLCPGLLEVVVGLKGRDRKGVKGCGCDSYPAAAVVGRGSGGFVAKGLDLCYSPGPPGNYGRRQ